MSAIPFFNFAETQIPLLLKVPIVLSYSAASVPLSVGQDHSRIDHRGRNCRGRLSILFSGTVIAPYNVSGMRIPGVLQRIAVCYLIVSLIYLHTNWKQQTVIGVGFLLLYWLLMTVVPVPGCEVWTVDDKACNLAAWLDRTILTEAHMWRSAKVFDPEGILSTIPAIVTTISGVLTGTWLTSEPPASAGGQSDDAIPSRVNNDVESDRQTGPPLTQRVLTGRHSDYFLPAPSSSPQAGRGASSFH